MFGGVNGESKILPSEKKKLGWNLCGSLLFIRS
jgi:hypothetical protein